MTYNPVTPGANAMEQLVAGRYELTAELGRGVSAVVYRAIDRRTGAPTAVKLVHPALAGNAAAAARLRRETELLAALTSPRFARVIDLDVHAGRAFRVTEFVDGTDVPGLLRRGRLRASEALRIGLEVARARAAACISAAADADISLAHLKLCEGQVKVIELAISPDSAGERRPGLKDEQTEVHAIGALLFELLTGRRPAPTPSRTARGRVRAPRAAAASTELPPAVREILDRCLTHDLSARYRSPAELVTTLAMLVQPAEHLAVDEERIAADRLTRREVEVLRLLAAGRSNREIADDLVVSVRTAEHHVAAIYAKIGGQRRADAVAYAFRHGLLPLDPAAPVDLSPTRTRS
jgi:eukaryotic-like serine/threonine-protein kinase